LWEQRDHGVLRARVDPRVAPVQRAFREPWVLPDRLVRPELRVRPD